MSINRVRIQNDGGPAHSTRITDADTGLPVENVQLVEIAPFGVENQPLKAILTMARAQIDIVAESQVKQRCLCCGRLANEH